jgi:hypothetical protein
MNLIERTIFFTVAQGGLYEKLAENLFYSLKLKHPEIKTACISYNNIKFCDYNFNISELCPLLNNVNESSINGQSYSFKLGIYKRIPKDFLSKFDKIIFYDCDSFCINKIEIDEIIFESKFYVPWCQSIVTKNPQVQSKINESWIWSGAHFYKHAEFASINNIKEWKNVNAGLVVISTKELDNLIEMYSHLTNKIYNFYGHEHGTEELTFSLMMEILDYKYTTPNICNNKIGQLCINENIENVINNNIFKYTPWFNSTDQKSFKVFPTCVHFPGQKSKLIYNI